MKSLNNADIHKSLVNIAKLTYPDREIPKFIIKMINEERKTFHGFYRYENVNKWGKKNLPEIHIFNLTRPTQYVLSTAVHELAHHCDYMIRKTSDHSKLFYQEFSKLLETAIKHNIIDFETIKQKTDSADIRQLMKYFKHMDGIVKEENLSHKIMKIFISYAEGSPLKQKGFVFSNIEKCWTKEEDEKILLEEYKNIRRFIEKEKILVTDKIDLDFQVHKTIYIRLPLEEVKLNLLMRDEKIYKYNKDKNYWSASFKVDFINQELARLKKLGINDSFYY